MILEFDINENNFTKTGENLLNAWDKEENKVFVLKSQSYFGINSFKDLVIYSVIKESTEVAKKIWSIDFEVFTST